MEPPSTLSKPLDAVLLVRNVLRRLNAGEMNTFEQRLKTQKVQYFAQIFGVSPYYDFNLYLRGPYSPFLARDLFSLEVTNQEYHFEKFTSNEMEARFSALNRFVSNKSIRELEVISTFHWLLNVACVSKEEARKRLKELKVTSSDELEMVDKALVGLPK